MIKEEICPCDGTTLDRMLRPLVMAVLARTSAGLHGYVIARQVAASPLFAGVKPDSTGLYRLLSAMEAEGCLQSGWDTEGSGPARRIYRLTPEGCACLGRWKQTLDKYLESIRSTVVFVEESLTRAGESGAGVPGKTATAKEVS